MTKSSNKKIFVIAISSIIILMICFTNYSFANSPGTYTAAVIPQYRNPITGVIEDSGGEEKEAIGQGMAESTISGQGLVEIDANGNIYTTFRLNNISAMSNISFSTSSGGAFYAVSAVNTNSAGNYADFRLQLPYVGAPVRCSMRVIPMGRDVVFFMTSSGLTPGQGDFVSAIDTSVAENQEAQASAKPSEGAEAKKQDESKNIEEKQKENDKEKSAESKKDSKKEKKNSESKKQNEVKKQKANKENNGAKMNFVYIGFAIFIILAICGFIVYKKMKK